MTWKETIIFPIDKAEMLNNRDTIQQLVLQSARLDLLKLEICLKILGSPNRGQKCLHSNLYRCLNAFEFTEATHCSPSRASASPVLEDTVVSTPPPDIVLAFCPAVNTIKWYQSKRQVGKFQVLQGMEEIIWLFYYKPGRSDSQCRQQHMKEEGIKKCPRIRQARECHVSPES